MSEEELATVEIVLRAYQEEFHKVLIADILEDEINAILRDSVDRGS